MAIFIKTNTPTRLLQDIKKKIDDHMIDTWQYDSDGDFTHDTDQWRYRAWLRPMIENNQLIFGIVCRKDRNVSVSDYAIYHGRFLEMLLAHFDNECQDIIISPLATRYDSVTAK